MSSSEQTTDGSTLVEPSAKKVKFDSNTEAPEDAPSADAATTTTNTPTKATNNGDAEHKSNNNNLNENNNNSTSSCSRITKPLADSGDAVKNNSHTQQANNNSKKSTGDLGIATAGAVDASDDDDDADEDEPDLDPTIAKCLEDVEAIQNEIENLNEKASEEILKVEQRFNQLRKPHYEKRNELLQGVPNFWISTFINHPHISAMLDEDDEDCLHYLTRLDVEEFEDIKSGYRIKFHFQENPYFSNTELVKELDLRSRVYPGSNSTQIQFKDTEQANRLKESCMVAREAKLNNSTARNRQQEPRTFFSWFLDNSDAFSDDIAEALKEEIWPNPLQYYLIQDESGAVNESDEDDDDDDDEEEDDAVVIDEDDDEEDGEGDLGDGGDDDDDDDDEDDSEVLDGSNSESSGHADDANEVQYTE